MNKIDIVNKLNELKDCETLTICHYIGTYVYEGFFTKDIMNFPQKNCLKVLVGDRTIDYKNIKSIEHSL